MNVQGWRGKVAVWHSNQTVQDIVQDAQFNLVPAVLEGLPLQSGQHGCDAGRATPVTMHESCCSLLHGLQFVCGSLAAVVGVPGAASILCNRAYKRLVGGIFNLTTAATQVTLQETSCRVAFLHGTVDMAIKV